MAWPEHGDEKKCGLSSSDSDPDTLADATTEIATNVSLENVYEFNFNGLTLRKWRPQFQSDEEPVVLGASGKKTLGPLIIVDQFASSSVWVPSTSGIGSDVNVIGA